MTQRAPFSERIERAILAIICLDLLFQGAETLPALADFARFFRWAGVGVWLVFTVEWCLRIRRAESWRKYAFSFVGVVDFLAILPLWLFTGLDLKALRAFRLFRLLRSTAKLAAHSRAAARLARAFSFARDQAGALFTGTAVLVVTAGLGMYNLEHPAQPEVFGSVLDGLWWSVVTLTSVGYGDVYPVTAGGKILATVVMFAGIGVIGAACGIMADALRKASASEVRDQARSGSGLPAATPT